MQNVYGYRGAYPGRPPGPQWGYPQVPYPYPPSPYPPPQPQYVTPPPPPQYVTPPPPPQYAPRKSSKKKSIICFFIAILVIIFVLFGFIGPWLHCNNPESNVCDKSKEYGLFCEKTCLYDNYGPSAGLWFFLLMSLPLVMVVQCLYDKNEQDRQLRVFI